MTGALPRVSVVVPVYDVERWLPESLDSLLGQDGVDLQVVVVDDGSPDGSGEIADGYAARDDRVTVLHVPNGGLGSARNVGTEQVLGQSTGDYLAFLDSDDVLPPGALSTLADTLAGSGSDFATGSIVRWEADGLHEPPWMRRLHQRRTGITAREHPEILGDVFAWNKLFRTSFWREQGLEWPEGRRYEDQPTTTRAYLAGTFDVVPDVVYHWRIRQDGTSITQQRASLTDLTRPVADQADGARRRAGVRRPRHVGVLRRPRARRRPAPLLRRDPRRVRRVVAAAGRRRPRPVGRAVARAQRPPAGAPPRRLAGRA